MELLVEMNHQKKQYCPTPLWTLNSSAASLSSCKRISLIRDTPPEIQKSRKILWIKSLDIQFNDHLSVDLINKRGHRVKTCLFGIDSSFKAFLNVLYYYTKYLLTRRVFVNSFFHLSEKILDVQFKPT